MKSRRLIPPPNSRPPPRTADSGPGVAAISVAQPEGCVWRDVYTSLTFFNGKLRTGRPIAAWIALSTAGAVTQMVGSPTPPQKS